MRIRVVRPDFWSDETLGHLSDSVRLFYVGLWCLSDDAGWLEWRPAQIAAALYPYKAVRRRERDVTGWGDALVQARRLVIHPCDCGFIPTLVKHQRQGGNPSFQYREKHRRHMAADGHDVGEESRLVRTSTPLEKGREGKGEEGREHARAPEEAARVIDWHQRVAETQRRGER